MPQLGETVIEGTITKWLKREGERIERDEPLFEISTDKVDTEVPSPVSGTVSKVLVAEGETVPVNTPLMEIADEGSAPVASSDAPAPTAAEAEPAAPAPAQPAIQPAPTPAVAGAGEEVVPMSHIRKAIAEHMHMSVQVSARAWNMVEANVEHIVQVRERAKDAFLAREGIKLTVTPFF